MNKRNSSRCNSSCTSLLQEIDRKRSIFFFFFFFFMATLTHSHSTQHTYYIYFLHTGYTFTHSLHTYLLIIIIYMHSMYASGYMFSLSRLHVLGLHFHSLILSRIINKKKKNSKLLHLLSFNNLVKQFISQI